jgi:predicted metal-dependent hydrolase
LKTLASICREQLLESAIIGLEKFNQGEYFLAHEYLEEAWKEDRSAGRNLYRSVLQVAVAYLQIERMNYLGALKMFKRVQKWIDPLPDICRGVNIGKLKRDAQRAYQELLRLGADKIGDYDRSLLCKVSYTIWYK